MDGSGLFELWKKRYWHLVKYAASGSKKHRELFKKYDHEVNGLIDKNSSDFTPFGPFPKIKNIRYVNERIGVRRLSKFCDSINSISRKATDLIFEMEQLEEIISKITNNKKILITDIEDMMEAYAKSLGYENGTSGVIEQLQKPYEKKNIEMRERFDQLVYDETVKYTLTCMMKKSKLSPIEQNIGEEYKGTLGNFYDRLDYEKEVSRFELYRSRADYYFRSKGLNLPIPELPHPPEFISVIDERAKVSCQIPPKPDYSSLLEEYEALQYLFKKTQETRDKTLVEELIKRQKDYDNKYSQKIVELTNYWGGVFEKLLWKSEIENAYDMDIKLANRGMKKNIEEYAKEYTDYACAFNGTGTIAVLMDIYLIAEDDNELFRSEFNKLRKHISRQINEIMKKWTGDGTVDYFSIFKPFSSRDKNYIDALTEMEKKLVTEAVVEKWPPEMAHFKIPNLIKAVAIYCIMISCV